MDFRAYIDGQSEMIVQASSVQWHNLAFTVPGYWDPLTGLSSDPKPTYISSSLNGSPVLTNYAWMPAWTNYAWDTLSSVFTGLNPALPVDNMNVTLSVIQAREALTIGQYPSVGNGYALILNFDDYTTPGAEWYEGKVTITTSPIPEPSSLLLVGAGVGGIALATWCKRENSFGKSGE